MPSYMEACLAVGQFGILVELNYLPFQVTPPPPKPRILATLVGSIQGTAPSIPFRYRLLAPDKALSSSGFKPILRSI